jgi:hypothetical protein
LLSAISAVFFSVAKVSIRFRARLLLLDFLAFCLVQPAQAVSNSAPELFVRDRRAVAQGASLAQAICGWPVAEELEVDQRKLLITRHKIAQIA